MINQLKTQPPTNLVLDRLKVLLETTNAVYNTNSSVLEEDIVSTYNSILDLFIDSLDKSIVGQVAKILPGSPADPLNYNVFTNAISRDIEALFAEIGSLDSIVSSSFNSLIANYEQSLQTSRRIGDKIGTYLLYSDPSLGAGFFFGDSFNTLQSIESGSSLVETEECFIDQNEGVVLLPLSDEPEKPNIKSIIINSPSNGKLGNNYQIDGINKNDLFAIADGKPDTWVEYENVFVYESNKPLVFDVTITLEKTSVINHIHINPINFGTPTPVKIELLETSKDGIEYISIKDEVPIADFISEDEENVFTLSSATSKSSGQGFYSFLPRKAQYIHLVLKQYTPYTIETNNGNRLRYAIGLRDINIYGRKFKTEGSIVSTSFSSSKEIRKLSIWASENPIEVSKLANISHSISNDDGGTWYPIQPQDRSGFDIPEVINFNTIDPKSINTTSPVTSLRHKINMSRNPDNFTGDITIKKEKISNIDILSMPIAGNESSLTLTQTPIKETVGVLMPFYGSFSCPTERTGVQGNSPPMDFDFLEFSVDITPVDVLRFSLPYENISNLIERIRVFVNDSQIDYSPQDTTTLSGLDANEQVYFITNDGRTLQFGVNVSGTVKGFVPKGGSKIKVCLDGDNPKLELTKDGYVLNLTTSTDGFKDNVSLVSVNNLHRNEAIEYVIQLPSGQDIIKVSNPIKGQFANIQNVSNTYSFPDYIGPTRSYNSTEANESFKGTLPPVFSHGRGDIENIIVKIEEYDFDNSRITSSKVFDTDMTAFIDGRSELDSDSTYTFNTRTGMLYLGQRVPSDRKVFFKFKMLNTTVIPTDKWEFLRNEITNKQDPQKIVLDPKYVVTNKRIVEVDGTSTEIKSVALVPHVYKSHAWLNQKVVKGTVNIDKSLFPEGVEPTEVSFIDGNVELNKPIQVVEEEISFIDTVTTNLWSSTLSIDSSVNLNGEPGFTPVRSLTNPDTEESIFESLVDSEPTYPGQWRFTVSGGVITIEVYSLEDPGNYTASYQYTEESPGIDLLGLYSIDYNTGMVYFAQPIDQTTGNITFDVSQYSAFYNIANKIQDSDIKEINEEEKTIKFKESVFMKFLKLDTVLKARPNLLKVYYDYYKTSSESLVDLEPYFSPICKDIAFRAVTSDLLKEL